MIMDKKDLTDVFAVVTIALCCPFAILLPPFNTLIKEKKKLKEYK